MNTEKGKKKKTTWGIKIPLNGYKDERRRKEYKEKGRDDEHYEEKTKTFFMSS